MIEDEQEDKDVRSEDQMHAEQRMREERSVKLLLGERPRKSASPMKAPPRTAISRKSLPLLPRETSAPAAVPNLAPVVPQQEDKQAEVVEKKQIPQEQNEQQQAQEETKPLSTEPEEPAKPVVQEEKQEERAKTEEEATAAQGTPEVKEEETTEQKSEEPQTKEHETTAIQTPTPTDEETKPKEEPEKREPQQQKQRTTSQCAVLTPKMPETTGSATARSLERAGASPHSLLTVDADSTVESPMATVLTLTPRDTPRSSSPGTGLVAAAGAAAAADESASPSPGDRVAEAFGIDFAAEDEDSTGMEPMTLPEAFEAIVTAAVTASGVNELPFVKDFLAAYRISMSTSTLFSDYSPLGEGALEQLRGVGRTLWRVFLQQRVIGAVTECQSLLSSNRVRHRCEEPRARVWRNKASVAWLRSTIALRNHERQLILSLENSERLGALQRVLEVHQDAFYRLDDMCIQFPAPSAFALGTLAKTWADEALLAYMELYGELQQCKEDAAAGGAAGARAAPRRAFLQALWDRLGDYHATLADNCTLYKTMLLYISVTDPISSLMENDIRQLEDCVAAFATLPARAVELHCMSRKQQCAVESAIKTRKRGSSSADVRRHNCKKLAGELLQTVLDPAALPPSDTREVQFHGTVRAVVDRASDPVVHHKFHRLRWCLLTDAFVLFSAGPVPTLLATIMLRDCLLYDVPTTTTAATATTGSTAVTGEKPGDKPSDKAEACFVLVTQEHRITCKHWKPGRLHRTMRANIARLRVFGVDLGDLVAFEHDITGIPRVALKCMEYVEQHGFSCEGIFRVNGKVSVMEALRAAFNARSRDIDFSGVNAYDVAQLFKKFLAELPEPLLTTAGYRKLAKLKVPSRRLFLPSSFLLVIAVHSLCLTLLLFLQKQATTRSRSSTSAVRTFCAHCRPSTASWPTSSLRSCRVVSTRNHAPR